MRDCPNHEGAYDCTPFCNICEGNQEYEPDAQETYYRIKFQGLPYDLYEYGVTALDAVKVARSETLMAGLDTDTPLTLGNATLRPAVYKEWTYGTEHYLNDGTFIKDTRKPCVNCSTPVNFHTHKAELGFCVECSDTFWNHTCDKCGQDNVMNLFLPLTRICEACEPIDN